MDEKPQENPWRLMAGFTVYGSAASKANSRRSVPRKGGGGNMFIKSKAATAFTAACAKQIPTLPAMLDALGYEVRVVCRIAYPNMRSDLDPSIVLDAMQKKVFENDRCVTSITAERLYDAPPRAEVVIYCRPWMVNGKMVQTTVNAPLRKKLAAERMAIRAAAKRAKPKL